MLARSLALAFTLGLTLVAVAHAQPEVDMTGGGAPASPAPVAVPGVTSSGAPFESGMLGFSFPVTLLSNLTSAVSLTAEHVPTIDILYFLGDSTALDFIAGVNVHKTRTYTNTMPPTAVDDTNVGFAAGVGYRMYKHRNRVATFLEPQVVMEWTNLSNSATFEIAANGLFGAEVMLATWCSVSGAVGAGFSLGNKGKDIQLATLANLAANLYWK
jgi:hypothetical protein